MAPRRRRRIRACSSFGNHRHALEVADLHRRARARLCFQILGMERRREQGRPVAVEGDLSAEGMRFAIVVARWNAVITDRLLEGALDAFIRSGAKRADIEIVRVPGAWEIPSAARTIASSIRSMQSSRSAVCCAARQRTTKPFTTKWRAASASRSRKPASRTALVF